MGTFLNGLLLLAGLLFAGIVLFTIFDIVGREDLDGSAKALWVLIVLIFPFIGAIVYLIGMSPKPQKPAPRPGTRRPHR